MRPLWCRSVSIRRSELEYVAADVDSSQPRVGGEKSKVEIRTRDAEYGFHTSHEMAIRRRENSFVASEVSLFRCDESGDRFYKIFPRLVKRELGLKMGSVEPIVKLKQRGTAEGTMGRTPSACKSVNAWL
jgi:hypothetical protein